MARDVVTVKIEGVEALIKELKRLGADVERAEKDALEAGAEIIRDAARNKAPGGQIEYGYERKRGVGGMDRAPQGSIFIGPDEPHWYYRFFEFGAGPHSIGAVGQILTLYGVDFVTAKTPHPGMAKKPFLRPALDENQTRTQKAIGDELEKAILKGRGG